MQSVNKMIGLLKPLRGDRSKQMAREKPDDKEKGMLKRMRRIRGGRTLPRSGGGVHEDKKSKKINDQLEEEYDLEIREYVAGYGEDYDLEDDMTEEEELYWKEWKKDLKDKEKQDAATDR